MAQDGDKLIFEMGLDSSAFERAIDTVKRKSKKTWGDITKSTLAHGRAIKEVTKIGGVSMAKLVKERKAVEQASGKSIASLRNEAAEYRKTYDGYTENVRLLRSEQADASAARRKEIKSEIADIKRLQKQSLGEHRARQGGVKGGSGGVKEKSSGAMVGGIAASAVTGMAKGLGGIAKSLGPILGSFSQMAPLITGLTTGLVGVVQLLIDAEAGAKEMNKTILQASGTGNYFAKNMNKGGAALEDISSTMGDIRNQATAWSNIKWGISKEDHMAMLSTLSQEGVAVEDFGEQFESLGKNADTAQAHAKSFGGAVQVAVAYSRQFGVSLTELTQFQGEMMTEMGAGLADVEKKFAMMSRAAGDSGIAQNKFFGIIRGVSADLSLYNSRLEDSVKVLGMIGKVMSPRNAQKFMQTAMQGLKGMSNIDRLKLNLLGGGKGGAAVTKDLGRKSKGLAEQMNTAGAHVKPEDILNADKDTAELLKDVPEKMQGEFREAILSMRTDQSMNKKGIYGQSAAMKNLSPGAALQSMKSALGTFGGGKDKKLSDMRGSIGVEEMSKQLGISEDQLDQMTKFEAAIDDQRAILKKGLAKGDPKLAEIDKMGYDDVMDTMDKGTKEELKNSGKIIDYNQKTSQFTSSMNDKIKALVDFVMNQLYNAMLGIWDIITDIASSKLFDPTGAKSEETKRNKLEVALNKTKNKELIDLLGKSSSVDDFRHKALGTEGAKSQADTIYGNQKVYEDLNKQMADLGNQIQKTSDPKEKAKLEADYKGLQGKKEAQADKYNAVVKGIDNAYGGKGRSVDQKGDRIRAAGQMAGVAGFDGSRMGTGDQGSKIMSSLQKGDDIVTALTSAGIAEADQAKILDKIRLTLDPDQLASTIAAAQKAAPPAPPSSSEETETASPTATTPTSAGPPTPSAPPTPTVAATPSVPTNAAAAVAAAKKDEPPTADQANDTLNTLDSIQTILFQKGIRMNESFMRSKFWKEGTSAVLEANREALFEYFMYSKMDPTEVAKGIKDNTIDPKTFGRDNLTKIRTSPPGGAEGGTVMKPRSPDSVFAAVKPGETISPAGAGGGAPQVSVSINGPGGQELGAMMRAAAINVIQEWQRRAKFT